MRSMRTPRSRFSAAHAMGRTYWPVSGCAFAADVAHSSAASFEGLSAHSASLYAREFSAPRAAFVPSTVLRAHVVMKLLFALLEGKRPVFEGRGDVASLRQCVQISVEAQRPDTESERPEEEREGVIPAACSKRFSVACVRPHSMESSRNLSSSTRTQRPREVLQPH